MGRAFPAGGSGLGGAAVAGAVDGGAGCVVGAVVGGAALSAVALTARQNRRGPPSVSLNKAGGYSKPVALEPDPAASAASAAVTTVRAGITNSGISMRAWRPASNSPLAS